MIRKHKNYNRPKKPFDLVRIKAENVIVGKYGLKNKREIWKSKAKLDAIRKIAKKLINESSAEEQQNFLDKLANLGYVAENVVDVLALTEENVLDRRLQTIVMAKKLATTVKGSRQLITHKHISINGNVVNIPSYHVSVSEENEIKKVGMVKKVNPKAVEKAEETPIETPEKIENKPGDETLTKEEPKEVTEVIA